MRFLRRNRSPGLRKDFPRVWPPVHLGLWRVEPSPGLEEPWFEAKMGRQIQNLDSSVLGADGVGVGQGEEVRSEQPTGDSVEAWQDLGNQLGRKPGGRKRWRV